jgi:hypothetical protein
MRLVQLAIILNCDMLTEDNLAQCWMPGRLRETHSWDEGLYIKHLIQLNAHLNTIRLFGGDQRS